MDFFNFNSKIMMTTQQIADRLAELCKKGDFEKAQKELFAEDAVSIEPQPSPGFEKETKGLEAILEKGRQFNSMMQEAHSVHISDPIVAGNAIAIALDMDVTMKGRGRSTMSEICVYEVKDGKIISEHFFW
ncbi:MAG: SnoaL-like domain-containing protein [Ginsengibacter sp.]